MNKKHKIIVAVTGASGAIYAKVLFDKLVQLKEQIEEVIAEWEKLTEAEMGYDWLAIGFRNIIGSWENEHDDYLI